MKVLLRALLLLCATSLTAYSYSALPLTFELNQGQLDGSVHYLCRGPGYTLFLTPNEIVMNLDGRNRDARVTMHLVAARLRPPLTGVTPLSTRSNYFIGDNPARWRTGVPHYAEVRYEQVYEGIDLVFRSASSGQLEYYFIVAPGADPGRIQIRFLGADVRSGRNGELILRTGNGDLVQRSPTLYQDAGGERLRITGRHLRLGRHEIGFDIGAYDHTRPLIIDPVLVYATFLGGTSFEEGLAVAVDASRNTYVTGTTRSTSFPGVSGGAIQSTNGGGSGDVFVTKINPAGTAIVYSTFIGGAGRDRANAIAVDGTGNAYVAGQTDSAAFPVTAGVIRPVHPGGGDAVFVTKINAAGTAIAYSTFLGQGNALGIAVDAATNAYIGGTTTSGIPGTSATSAQQSFGGGSSDGFVTKINPAATAILYATFLGGNAADAISGITVDAAGNAYVTGSTSSLAFPGTSTSPIQATFGGNIDAFVTKINTTGSTFSYSTYLGGTGRDDGAGIALDVSGNAYVTGTTTGSSAFPGVTTASLQPAPAGGAGGDAFVTKINTSGTAIVYSTYLGSTDFDVAYAIAVDAGNNAHIAGWTLSSNFPGISGSSLQSSNAGNGDAFVVQINPAASAISYSTYFGGSNGDEARGIAVDTDGSAYVAGTTNSTSLPSITSTSIQATNGGTLDAFVIKISGQAGTVCVPPPSGTMIAWYPFDEPLGSVSANLATGNAGVQMRGPARIVGKVDRALHFNGIDQYVESPSSIATNIGPATLAPCSGSYSNCPGDFSIDTWIRVDSFSFGVLTVLDKRIDTLNAVKGYHFFVYQGSIGLQLADDLGFGYSNYLSPPLTPSLTDGGWHHVAVTVRRNSITGIGWYHNGVLVGTNDPTDRLGSLENPSALRIGTRTAASSLTGWFAGDLDELEIFNRELLPAEVAAIATADSAGKCK
jgi:concanavalin A-like lectin/glucanase superfamily protein/beta-propeller repeat-containing protein